MPDATSPSEYASPEEARLHISALNDDDILKLLLAAGLHIKRCRLKGQVEPEELLGEAVTRTLDGRRQWRKAIATLIYHLDRTMESIAGHRVGDAKADQALLAELTAEHVDPKTSEPRHATRAEAEARLLAREELEAVQALFTDAPDALTFLQLKAFGHSQSEIMIMTGMDQRRFETARKKVERQLLKYATRSQKETP